jgi:hypothetical protein
MFKIIGAYSSGSKELSTAVARFRSYCGLYRVRTNWPEMH